MKKILYVDTETTGLDENKNDIIQLSGCIETDGNLIEEFDFKVQPFSFENIDAKALSVNGISEADLKTYPPPQSVYYSFTKLLGKHVDKFNKADKFYPAGYNVDFDLRFLKSFFLKMGDVYFGSWINWRRIDPLPILTMWDACEIINLENYKLETVCKHFGIEIKAHDAMSDITATRTLIKKVMDDQIVKSKIVHVLSDKIDETEKAPV